MTGRAGDIAVQRGTSQLVRKVELPLASHTRGNVSPNYRCFREPFTQYLRAARARQFLLPFRAVFSSFGAFSCSVDLIVFLLLLLSLRFFFRHGEGW